MIQLEVLNLHCWQDIEGKHPNYKMKHDSITGTFHFITSSIELLIYYSLKKKKKN